MNPAALLNPKAFANPKAAHGKGKPVPSQTGGMNGLTTSPSKPRFDPKALLDPKTASKQQRDDKSSTSKTNGCAAGDLFDTLPDTPEYSNSAAKGRSQQNGSDWSSMLERVHNVSERTERPRKKQKKDHLSDNDDEGRGKATFSGGGNGTVLGQYVKDKRDEGKREAGPKSTMVDLTDGDDDATKTQDDDVVFVRDGGDKEVCLGSISNAKVNAHKVPCPRKGAWQGHATQWPMMKVELRRRPGTQTQIITVIDPQGNDFGSVDVRTAIALAPLMDGASICKLRVQSRLDARKRQMGEQPGTPVSHSYSLTITLYAPKKMVTGIGKHLSQKNVFLRQPLGVDNGVEVVNPHAAKTPAVLPRTGVSSIGNGYSGTSFVTRTTEEVRNEVLGMFDNLKHSDDLPEMEADPCILTPLLRHQKQGLHFMTARETERNSEDGEDESSLWKPNVRPNGQRMFVNVITGNEERARPSPALGGILADVMGLGKTLMVLSLIVGSLEQAQLFAKGRPPRRQDVNDFELVRNSKATLLVSPLSTVANWEEQIKAHVKSDTISFYIYHGSNRIKDVDELAKYDLVITTYSVVSSEFSRSRSYSPLQLTHWFRVVLDEAHSIREQTTLQSKGVCALSAQRRWAVTGTPVQNRLEDLGALIKFLRIKPFDEKNGFSQFILAPFKNADPEILPKLRLLVDTITLRRLKDRIDLPPRRDQIVKLEFSSDERALYEAFAKDSDNKVRAIARRDKKSLGGKAYAHVLQAILRLRLICAHGPGLLSDEDMKVMEGLNVSSAIDLEDEDDDRPALTAKQAYDMLHLMRESDFDRCSRCEIKIGPKDNIAEDVITGKDEVIGHMTACYQILCPSCFPDFKKECHKKATPDNHMSCPLCEQYVRVAFFELTLGKIEEDEESRLKVRDNPKLAKQLGRYNGPHTKTKALLQSLIDSVTWSLEHPDEPPIKSVVFSGWTSHLDLIALALQDHHLPHTRLDGKMSRAARTRALQEFQCDPNICIILVSLTAGGLGLNLTVASRVYVMEPQFNPAAEAQAVERVHRLGQKRAVIIQRYIMHDSFEEKMLELQKKKQNLASLSMDRGEMKKISREDAAKKRLEELRSLFR